MGCNRDTVMSKERRLLYAQNQVYNGNAKQLI